MSAHDVLSVAGYTEAELEWLANNAAVISGLLSGQLRLVSAVHGDGEGDDYSVPQTTWDMTSGFVVRIVKTPLEAIPSAIVWTKAEYEADPTDPDHAVMYHPDGRIEDAASFDTMLGGKPAFDGCIVLVNKQFPCPPEHCAAAQALVDGTLAAPLVEDLVEDLVEEPAP